MIRRHLMALGVGLILLDAVIAVSVFVLVATIRFMDGGMRTLLEALGGVPLWLAAVAFAALWVAALWTSGLYQLEVRWRIWSEIRDVARATLAVLATTLSALFLVKGTDVSRLFLAFLFIAQPIATVASRLLLRAVYEAVRRRGHDPRFMLVAGTGQLAQDFADWVEGHAGLGVRIIGHLVVPGEVETTVTRPVLGTIDDIEGIFHSWVVDEVAVCLPAVAGGYLEPIVGLSASEGKTVRVASDPLDEVLPGAVHEELDGIVLRSLVHNGQREMGLIVKRTMDVVGAALGLILLSPAILATAAAILVSDGAPVFFGQTRIGLNGRPFTMYKFRTMVRDAEGQLDAIMHLNERSGAAFKVRDDPRITKIGRWMRKTSIDEVPQLWNVLRGTMSLVGPRPPLPREVAEYDIWHRRRLSMKPGISGLWQIEARHEPDFDRWVEHDLRYIDGWSIWLDLKIMLRTIPALFKQGGY